MIAFALTDLAAGERAQLNTLILRMVRKWPSQPALSICFAITSASSALAENVATADVLTSRAYKLTSLLAADIFAIESMGQVPVKGHHLLHFWTRTDPYFLDLA